MRSDLTDRTAGESAAKAKIRGFEDRQRAAEAALKELERKRAEVAQKTVEMRSREDWAAYLKLKAEGAPDVVLTERVKQILRQYKDTPADLSEPNQELQRLLRNR